MKHIGRKLLNGAGIAAAIILGCILILNVTLIIRSFYNPDQVPSVFGYTPLIVRSGSMEPAISTGDLIFIKADSFDQLHAAEAEGDIIAFWQGDHIITHRAVDVLYEEEVLIQTKGDANNDVDAAYVTAESLIGYYTGRIPYVGDFIYFLQTTTGMILLILLPVCIIFAQEGVRLRKRHLADQQKMKELESILKNVQSDFNK